MDIFTNSYVIDIYDNINIFNWVDKNRTWNKIWS